MHSDFCFSCSESVKIDKAYKRKLDIYTRGNLNDNEECTWQPPNSIHANNPFNNKISMKAKSKKVTQNYNDNSSQSSDDNGDDLESKLNTQPEEKCSVSSRT